MTLSRRRLLSLAAGAAAFLPVASSRARARTYPMQPVRIVVGFAAGGVTDILARLMGQWLSERFDRPFVIENRPGAGGNIATETVVNAPADGYSLLMVTGSHAINMTLYEKLNYDLVRDIAPVAGIARVPNVMEVNPSFPAKTVPEFVAYAKANPGKVNVASGGNGTAAHVAGELFKMLAGVDIVHVPYRGSPPALTDLFAGHVHVIFDPIPSSIEHIRAGKLRPLAVTTAARSSVLPGVPTVGDFVPGYEASTWAGIGAPRGTPPEIVTTLNEAINVWLADPKVAARFAELGVTAMPGSPSDFGMLIVDEVEKWAKVVKFSGARAE